MFIRNGKFDPAKHKWSLQAAEFCCATVAGRRMFVKRASQRYSAWSLLQSVVAGGSVLEHAPKILATEQWRDHYYVYSEELTGRTLEERLRLKQPIPTAPTIVSCVAAALASIARAGYWYTDLCLKNVFVTDDGDVVLIDIDSSAPHTQSFSYTMRVAYDYLGFLNYYVRTMGIARDAYGLSGDVVMQAALVAFAVDAGMGFRIPRERKPQVIHGVLSARVSNAYHTVLKKLAANESAWHTVRKFAELVAAERTKTVAAAAAPVVVDAIDLEYVVGGIRCSLPVLMRDKWVKIYKDGMSVVMKGETASDVKSVEALLRRDFETRWAVWPFGSATVTPRDGYFEAVLHYSEPR